MGTHTDIHYNTANFTVNSEKLNSGRYLLSQSVFNIAVEILAYWARTRNKMHLHGNVQGEESLLAHDRMAYLENPHEFSKVM